MSGDRIENTRKIRATLRAEMDRTKIGAERFTKRGENLPPHFSKSTLDNWVAGRVKTIRASDLDYAFDQYAKFPTAETPVTTAMRRRLRREIERTRASPAAIKLDASDIPFELKTETIERLFDGSAQVVNEHHWSFVLKRLKSFPTEIVVELDEQKSATLKRELRRTRMSAPKLRKLLREITGREYSRAYISELISGELESLPQSLWDNTTALLTALPDAPRTTGQKGRHNQKLKDYIPITKTMSNDLCAQLERTGASSKQILRTKPKALGGLSAATISKWRSGEIKRAGPAQWQFVLERLESFPDKKRPQPNPEKYLGKAGGLSPIPEEDIGLIEFHRERTAVGYNALLSGEQDVPQGLRPYTISAWVRRATKSANRDHVRWVINHYASLPDKR